VRTQAQDGKRDIEKIYLKAVNNATQFIYIENQYFRWPPLAEAIKAAAEVQTGAGRDPGLHGNLHLFVITNASPDGVGPGSLNTQRMLESLGRGDTIPEITKLQRIEQAKAQANAQTPTLAELLERQALLTLTSLTDALGGGEISDKAVTPNGTPPETMRLDRQLSKPRSRRLSKARLNQSRAQA